MFDADGLAPDVSTIQPSRFWFFWVRAASVWSAGSKILRPIRLHELFAIWDFQGKLECHSLSRKQSLMLQHRFYSPPGKISCLIAHTLLRTKADTF